MKRLAMSSAFSLAAAILIAPVSKASGFIVVDSLVGGAMAVPFRSPIVRPHVVPVRRGPVVPAPATSNDGVSIGLHMQSEQIKVDITDQVAKTYITQTFMNDTDRNLAGTYLFPLPEDTTFSSFSLHIDGKPVEGKIMEAQEARKQYEEIVRSMVDPGLLEYADYKTVRARIFPIPAHGTKKVELEYTQVLHAENGMLKYRFPLKADGETAPIDEVKIDAKLNSKQGLRTIWSPTHTITSTRSDNNQAKVAMLTNKSIPDKDFLLYFSVSNKELSANLLTHKNEGEDGYFLLTVTPPVQSNQVIGKDIILIADTSGSMLGDKIVQTKRALKYIVNALTENDKFNVVQFNTDVDSFKSGIVAATPESKKAADAFIDDLEAHGGTNISDALHTGTTMLNQTTDRPAYVVLMTDGEPTVGETNIQALLKSVAPKRDTRIFDFGVGYDVNTKLLTKLAEEHHGTAQYVEPSENLETAISSFYQKIKSPVLTNVSITYDGAQVKDVYPREVKDIFAGTQVLLIGKYKGGGKATVDLTGKVNGVAKSYSFPLTFEAESSEHTYLPRLWAMRRIGHLTEVAQANGENREVVDEIVALSKKYGIITNYTSFLVTDPNETHGSAMNRRVSVLPLDLRGSAMMTTGHGSLSGAATGGAVGTGSGLARVNMGKAVGPAAGFGLPFGVPTGRGFKGNADAAPGLPWVAAIPSNEVDLSNSAIHLPAGRTGRHETSGQSALFGAQIGALAGGGVRGSRLPNSAIGLPPHRKDPAIPASVGVVEGPRDMNMFAVEPTVTDERHYTSGRAQRHQTATPSTGRSAFDRQKALDKLKDVEVIAKDASAIKSVEDKTFYLRDGVWVDSNYSESSAKPQVIQFGGKEYFDLIHANPGISKYLAVGKQVILFFKGHWYKIVSPPAS